MAVGHLTEDSSTPIQEPSPDADVCSRLSRR
jgi:hypothetical protein